MLTPHIENTQKDAEETTGKPISASFVKVGDRDVHSVGFYDSMDEIKVFSEKVKGYIAEIMPLVESMDRAVGEIFLQSKEHYSKTAKAASIVTFKAKEGKMDEVMTSLKTRGPELLEEMKMVGSCTLIFTKTSDHEARTCALYDTMEDLENFSPTVKKYIGSIAENLDMSGFKRSIGEVFNN